MTENPYSTPSIPAMRESQLATLFTAKFSFRELCAWVGVICLLAFVGYQSHLINQQHANYSDKNKELLDHLATQPSGNANAGVRAQNNQPAQP